MKTIGYGLNSIRYWMQCESKEAGKVLVVCATAVAVALILTRKR